MADISSHFQEAIEFIGEWEALGSIIFPSGNGVALKGSSVGAGGG